MELEAAEQRRELLVRNTGRGRVKPRARLRITVRG